MKDIWIISYVILQENIYLAAFVGFTIHLVVLNW